MCVQETCQLVPPCAVGSCRLGPPNSDPPCVGAIGLPAPAAYGTQPSIDCNGAAMKAVSVRRVQKLTFPPDRRQVRQKGW
jgi:hypothetical protein